MRSGVSKIEPKHKAIKGSIDITNSLKQKDKIAKVFVAKPGTVEGGVF